MSFSLLSSNVAPEMGVGEDIAQFYFTQMISGVVSPLLYFGHTEVNLQRM